MHSDSHERILQSTREQIMNGSSHDARTGEQTCSTLVAGDTDKRSASYRNTGKHLESALLISDMQQSCWPLRGACNGVC